jgi:hypothetical protein
MPRQSRGAEGIMDLERERRRVLERDAEWAALASQGKDVDRILWPGGHHVPPGARRRLALYRRHLE